MLADVLATCVTRPPPTMLLIKHDDYYSVFYEEGFSLYCVSTFLGNAIFYKFAEKMQHDPFKHRCL